MKWCAFTMLDRYNYIIFDVLNLDNREPVNYGLKDFFPIFDAVFTVNLMKQGWNISTQLAFLKQTWDYFSSKVDYTLQMASDKGLTKLKLLFAILVLRFNNTQYGGPLPNDLSKSISLAKVSYRVYNWRKFSNTICRFWFIGTKRSYLQFVYFSSVSLTFFLSSCAHLLKFLSRNSSLRSTCYRGLLSLNKLVTNQVLWAQHRNSFMA